MGLSLPGPLKKVPPIGWVLIGGVVLAVLYIKMKGTGSSASSGLVPSTGDASGGGGGSAGTPGANVLSPDDLATLLAQQQAQEQAWLTSLLGTISNPTPGGAAGTTGTPAQILAETKTVARLTSAIKTLTARIASEKKAGKTAAAAADAKRLLTYKNELKTHVAALAKLRSPVAAIGGGVASVAPTVAARGIPIGLPTVSFASVAPATAAVKAA